MTNFLIITHARSGSTLLSRSLNMHPDLNVQVEILHAIEPSVVSWRKKYVQELYGIENFNFIYDDIYTRIADEYDLFPLVKKVLKDCNGFKILVQQLPMNYKIWQQISSLENLKIIFLRRKNLLEAALSLKLAQKTKIWQRKIGDPIVVDEKIKIEPSFIKDFFEYNERSFQELTKIFKNHKCIDVTYEDLIRNWDQNIETIENFLNVKKTILPFSTEKRTKSKPKNLIENFEELSKEFINTKWKNMFYTQMI